MSLRSTWVLLAFLPACSATGDPTAEATQLVVRLDGTGAPLEIPIEPFGSIFWLLPPEAETTGEVRVVLDGAFDASSPCATTYGFDAPSGGTRRSAPIAPGSGAVICFHDAGEYRFRVEGLASPVTGIVRVGGVR